MTGSGPEAEVVWPATASCDVFCIRHGQSEANVGGELVGRRDVPLTELGRREAAAVATYLSELHDDGPVLFVSSPLQRAIETARAVAAPFGAGVLVDDRLVELDYGELEGRVFVDLLAHWPPDWIADHSVPCPGGEAIGQVTERVVAAVSQHAAEASSAGAALVVVTHLGPIKSLVGVVTGAMRAAQERLHVSPGSVTRIRLRHGTATLVALNLVMAT